MNRFLGLLALVLSACATPVLPPTFKQASDLGQYKFVHIAETVSISAASVTGRTAVMHEIDPARLMEGLFLKRGLVRLTKLEPELLDQSLTLRWGISGKRDVTGPMGLASGYTQEVTITLLDARSLRPVFTCTAEGIGRTDVDDIRNAIESCLSGLQ